MTEEDLNSKLMQRAELVAQREELDHMLESASPNDKQEFDLFLRFQQDTSWGDQYYESKSLSFFRAVLDQLAFVAKPKFQSVI